MTLRKPLLLSTVVLPFVLRLALVWQDFERLVKNRPLLEDDFFYYLTIARNVVAGTGFTADGETPTTGFQFFQQLLCIAVTAPFGQESLIPFRLVLTVQVILTAVAALVLFRTLALLWTRQAAWLGALLFSWWLPLIRYGNNGMETSLVVLVVLLLFSRLLAFVRGSGSGSSIGLGLLSATCVFSRIDLVAVAAGVVAALMWLSSRGRLDRGQAVAGVMATAIGATCALAALGLFNAVINGHVLPDSGEAVRHLAGIYAPSFGGPLGVGASLLEAARAVVGDHPLAQVVLLNRLPVPVLGLLATGMIGGAAVMIIRSAKGNAPPAEEALLVAGCVTAGVLAAFYVTVVPAYWFFSRYLFPLSLVLLIFAVPVLLRAAAALRRPLGRALPALIVLAASLYAAGFVQRWTSLVLAPPPGFSGSPPRAAPLDSLAVCHNYDIALWVQGNVAGNDRLAMWQGGLVSYMTNRSVLHLDGVVNREALEAWVGRRLDRYLLRKRVDWFVDFRGVASIALSRCADPGRRFVPAGVSQCQSGTQVVAYRVSREQ